MSFAFGPGEELRRVVGTCDSGDDGPTLFLTVGIHGNEPAGLLAARRVLVDLASLDLRLRGRFVVRAGNLGGLRRDLRFLASDMNRMWRAADVAALRARDARGDRDEEAEVRELLAELETELARLRGPFLHADLHSTSGAGPPFATFVAGEASRRMAEALGVPVLLGLQDLLGGTMIEYVAGLGHAAIVVEGGQNRAPSTVDHHESVIWMLLVEMGLVDAHRVPELDFHRARLAAAAGDLPRVLRIAYRREIAPDEPFRMVPGWSNFDPVEEGELLAWSGRDLEDEVRAPWTGTLLMPRYQDQGSDGFFLAREA